MYIGNWAGVDVLQPFDAHIGTAAVAEAAALVEGNGRMVGVMDAEDDFVAAWKMRTQQRIETDSVQCGSGLAFALLCRVNRHGT